MTARLTPEQARTRLVIVQTLSHRPAGDEWWSRSRLIAELARFGETSSGRISRTLRCLVRDGRLEARSTDEQMEYRWTTS